MSTQYTPSLRLALPGTGELDGLWGQVVNDQITELVEQAVTGHVHITTWTANAHTLTSIDGTIDEARAAVLIVELGDGLVGSPFTLTAPDQPKVYIIQNATGDVLNFTTVNPLANTLTIPNGRIVLVSCTGPQVTFGVNYATNFRSTGLDVVDGATTQSYVLLAPAGSITLNASVSNFYYMPTTGGGPLFVSLTPSSGSGLTESISFLALLVNPGTGTITWPGNVRWPNNTAPIINSNTFNLFLFTDYSGSGIWYGAVLNNYV